MDDSSDVLVAALEAEAGLSTAAEILDNTSRYDPRRISKAIISHFSKSRSVVYERDSRGISGQLSSDFLRFANTRLLNQLIEDCSAARNPVNDLIVGYCVFELLQRMIKADHQAFRKAEDAYSTERFFFSLVGLGQVSLGSVRPEAC
jgi:hypothetical protein